KLASSWGAQVGPNRQRSRGLSVIRTRSSGLSWTAPKAAANSSDATSRTLSPPSTSGPGGRRAARAAIYSEIRLSLWERPRAARVRGAYEIKRLGRYAPLTPALSQRERELKRSG